MTNTYVVSTRLNVHPSKLNSAVECWYESLPAVAFPRRVRVGSRLWLATTRHQASSDPLELYRVQGVLWLYGRPIRVELEFSIWSDTVSQVALRPANLAWPVRTEQYERRAAQVLDDVVASVTYQSAPLVAQTCVSAPRLVPDFQPLSGLQCEVGSASARVFTLARSTDAAPTRD